ETVPEPGLAPHRRAGLVVPAGPAPCPAGLDRRTAVLRSTALPVPHTQEGTAPHWPRGRSSTRGPRRHTRRAGGMSKASRPCRASPVAVEASTVASTVVAASLAATTPGKGEDQPDPAPAPDPATAPPQLPGS